MRDAGATLKVAKNRLAKLALDGTDVEHISDLFQGPVAIAYSDDPVTAPKIVSDFAKSTDKLVVLRCARRHQSRCERCEGPGRSAVAR